MKTTFFLWIRTLLVCGGMTGYGLIKPAAGAGYINFPAFKETEIADRNAADPVVYTEILLGQVPGWVFRALTQLNPEATLVEAWIGNDGSYKVGFLLYSFHIHYTIFARW